MNFGVLPVGGGTEIGEIGFEEPMPQYTQAGEHGATEHDRINQRRAIDIFNDVSVYQLASGKSRTGSD